MLPPSMSLTILTVVLAIGSSALIQPAGAQELDCRVQVDYSQIAGTDRSALDELESRMADYLNRRSWTSHRVQSSERIGCRLQVIIQDEPSTGTYRARVVVSSRRPVYGTAQSTPVLRLNDPEWTFSYSRGESLVHNLNRYDPLASVLDFYAFLILGMDFDTFAEHGGTSYLEQSRSISDRARSDPSSTGWDSFGSDRNRSDFIEALLSSRHRDFRGIVFRYHYEVLDRYTEDPEAAQATALDLLQEVAEMEDRLGRTYVFDHFFSSKYQELGAVFRGGSQRQQARALLTRIDPSHSSTYNDLLN